MKLKEVFEKSVQFLKDKKFETPRLDVELMMAEILKIDRIQIYLRFEQPLKEDEVQKCRDALKRRAQGEPIAYIVGNKGFYKQDFFCGPGVLVPRPESEIIVENALDFIEKNKIENPRVLDLGAGTGCIGFSIQENHPTASLVSVERSEVAYSYLQKNFEGQSRRESIQLIHGDVLQVVNNHLGSFDIVVANPPYIDRADPLVQESVVKFEPQEALFASDNGLADIKQWLIQAAPLLKPLGMMAFEIGASQGNVLLQFAKNQFPQWSSKVVKDLSGLDRTLICVRQ